MRQKLLRIAEHALFALNVLIVFLFIFEKYISLPSWLQVVGRMHPLFLHFPIVLIILSVVFYFLKHYTNFVIDQVLLKHLFLLCALLTSLTIIMGLFLSRESEYGGEILSLHKWMAIAVGFFISGSYYYFRTEFSPLVFKSGSAILILLLVVTGHLGAELTHGKNFLWEPVSPAKVSEQVPLEEAMIYDHVISTIFKEKCSACHNESRAKGKLVLTTKEGINKGGKDGNLFEVDAPGGGLLLQRIHLPESAKKHMPPANKPQLTDEEMEILELWIQGGLELDKRVVEIYDDDKFRVALEQYFTPEEPTYDFEAADAAIIAKLNSAYRVIYPISSQSPALAVSMYSSSTFTPAFLEELKPIQKQIVTLDLNKMPVEDGDLKIIAQLENLRKLNLNFSAISGTTLQELSVLKNLNSLSISGTSLSDSAMKNLELLTNLKSLYCWSTGVDNQLWDELKRERPGLRIETGFLADYSKKLKLTAPRILNEKNIYNSAFQVELSHPIHGVTIRYTLDGSSPDSLQGSIYENDLIADALMTTLQARAFKEGWIGSESIKTTFYNTKFTPDSIWSNSPFDQKYYAQGAKTLVDHENGNLAFGNYDGWLGYRESNMDIELMFDSPVSISAVGLSTRLNNGAHIFPPTEINVWGGENLETMKLLSTVHPLQPLEYEENAHTGIECSFEKQEIRFLRIVVEPLSKLPNWHSNKGEKAWFFTDEILFN